MMRFLKAKFIVPALIVILVIIIVMLYFVGALKASAKSFDNIPFDLSKYTNANDVEEFDNRKLVAVAGNYQMYFDERTTVVTIKDITTGKEYTTAIPSSEKEGGEGEFEGTAMDTYVGEAKEEVKKGDLLSNIVVYYLKKDGNEAGTALNAMDNSVNFFNELDGEYEKHYSFFEDIPNKTIEVCYDIGKFTSKYAYFPKKAQQSEWVELFKGNIMFEENKNSQRNTGNISYTGRAYVYDDEALAYLEKNDLIYYDDNCDDDEMWPIEKDDSGSKYYIVTLQDENLYKEYGVHLNCEGSPLKCNPFFGATYWSELTNSSYYRLEQSASLKDENGNPVMYYTINDISTAIAKELYLYFYKAHTQFIYKSGEKIELTYDDGTPVIRGGFHARDEEGNFLYQKDDAGNYILDEDGNYLPVQGFYTFEMVERQDAYFNVEADTSLPVFRIALQFKLLESGLRVSVIHDSVLDSSNWKQGDDQMYNAYCKISRIEVLPMLASSYDAREGTGSIILPDGCGSVIEFNNHAEDRGASAYYRTIYGSDQTFLVNNLTAITPDLMYPMFGFLANGEGKGVMAVVRQGASLTGIRADSNRRGTPYNYSKFITYVRELEKLEIAYGWYRYKIDKWAENICPSDLVYDYTFIQPEDLDYSSLAEIYRAYLCDQYGIDPAGNDTTTNTRVNLNIVGAYRHYQLTLGIIYYRKSPLTSFDQAQEIVQELLDNGLNTLSVSYKAWTQDALEYKLRPSYNISSALGGKKDMQDLSAFLASKGIDFYPEQQIATNKGYKYGFGNSKYTARGVGNVAAKEYAYDLSKLQYDKKSKPTYLVSPKYYLDISSKLQKSFAKTKANGVYLLDIGNMKIGDYRKTDPIYAEANKYTQTDTIKYWGSQGYKVQVDKPYDYGIAGASNIVGAPLTTTLEPIVDYAIPFYQLVLSGLVDYSMEVINGSNDNSVEWYLAKALESGSNLNFQISYKDNSILLETDYTQYYRINYEQWKDTIIDMTKRLDEIGIHGGRLVKHETLIASGLKIAKVEYSNGVKLYINTNSRDVEYIDEHNATIPIRAYSWYVIQ